MKKITTYLLFLLSIILLVNCSSDSEEKTEQILGTISTDDIINITTSSATFGGNLTSSGSSVVNAKGIVYGTTNNPTIDDNVELSNNNNLGNFAINKTGLTPNTTYYVRAFVTTAIGTNYGGQKTFTTTPELLATITTNDVSNITTTSATCGGNLTFDGNSTVAQLGLVYSTNPNPTTSNQVVLNSNTQIGSYDLSITNLNANTTYYVRAFATNSIGTSYGEEKTFTTPPVFQANCLPTNLQNGVIAFYSFSSGSLNDYSGYNRHLTNPTTASSTTDRSGNSNCAFNFVKANDEFLKIINPSFLDNYVTNPYSISVWVKTTGTRDGADYEGIINRIRTDNNALLVSNWSIGLHDCRQVFLITPSSQMWELIPIGETNCSSVTDSWHHIVATYDGSVCNVYLDNMQQNIYTSSGQQTIHTFSDLLIGKDFNGIIDDIIIYNRVLNATERTQLYNLSGCCN